VGKAAAKRFEGIIVRGDGWIFEVPTWGGGDEGLDEIVEEAAVENQGFGV